MDVSKISIGPNPPGDVHVIVEIPLGGVPVKYELDKSSGALFVDRFLHPHTKSLDGDPCDVVVAGQVPVIPGCVVRCRPIGALLMKDEAGPDEKILAVPVDDLHPFYSDVRSYRDLPSILCDQIAHFFRHYKDLEKSKWVNIVEWVDVPEAEKLILESIARASQR